MRSFIIIILVSLVLLSSCTIVEGDVRDRITSPDNIMPPLEGKWVIDKLLKSSISHVNEDELQQIIGREALFHKDAVIIVDNYTTKPSFKMKIVNAVDYLLYKYKSTPSILGIEDEKVEVITILNDNAYFYEFIKLDEETMIVNIDESFYRMKRYVKEVSLDEIDRYINIEKSMLRTFGTTEDEIFNSGLMIGLKIPSFDKELNVPTWDYKTIWINSQENTIKSIYELNQILIPRINGFWILENNRIVKGNSINDEIVALPQFRVDDISNKEDESLVTSNDNLIGLKNKEEMPMMALSSAKSKEDLVDLPSILRNILFIGNDYISVENIDLNLNSKRTLQVYAIDNLEEKKPIKLSDLLGENGKEIFTENAIGSMSIDSNIVPNEENIGLVRKNGYWILKGRVNYKQNSEELFNDFNIKAIPPKEMVNYDEQVVPWDAVRLIVPDAIDVFSSPNNEFIVVITSSHLIVYYLEDGNIINNPAARIKLPYEYSVIMSQWAIGRYSNIWQNEIIKNGGKELDY